MKKINQMVGILSTCLMVGLGTAQEKNNGSDFVTNVSGVGIGAATFLEIGVGARAAAMGGAYAAISDDATALYWNPAGVAWVDGLQIEFMHSEWLPLLIPSQESVLFPLLIFFLFPPILEGANWEHS